MHPKVILRFAILAGVVGTATIPALLAVAEHQNGATYSGGHAENGAVSVELSSDGTRVEQFEALSVPVDPFSCPDDAVDISITDIPIITFLFHDFSGSAVIDGVSVEVDGDFEIPGFVSGFITTESAGGGCFNITTYIAGIDGGGSTGCPTPGDVNNDGNRNSIDAALLLQLGAGLIAGLPCES